MLPKYALADECIDKMRAVVKRSAEAANASHEDGEALLCKDLEIRLKRSAKDEGITVLLPAETKLVFFRHTTPTQATAARRKQEPIDLEHFFVQIGDQQYTFKTELECNKVLGVVVKAITIPRSQFPPGAVTAPRFPVFSG